MKDRLEDSVHDFRFLMLKNAKIGAPYFYWQKVANQLCQPLQNLNLKVLQTIQMKLILLCVWAEPAVLGSAKTALKFIYEI